MAVKRSAKIRAERDGKFLNFSEATWNAMPEGKYGWTMVKAEVPATVKENMAKAKKADA